MKSNVVISITIKDEVVLNLVFTPPPCLLSEQGQDCSSLSEDMSRVKHQSQWLPHLNLLKPLRS